ncbi:MAG: patatin-like phospholipase family protein, partial [Clostridia bacterium]|nr:patatin-like phospholipase family protein [Clostridia bacterium]
RTFEKTDIPFAVVACNFETMEPVVFRSGPLYKAVRASISIPGVFTPVERDGELLVDGGLLRRVPSDIAREMGADVVVAVDVGYRGTRQRTSSILEHVMHAIDILEWVVAQQTACEADVTVAPDTSFMNPIRLGGQAAECIARGRDAARAMIPEIRAAIEKYRQTAAIDENGGLYR